jgi:hypothetical protein
MSKALTNEERRSIRKDFKRAVNMGPKRLERWLGTKDSRRVGQKAGGRGESVGHQSGRRIVHILRTKNGDLTDADVRHMRKVVGYVDRHLAQRPKGDVTDTAWRASLMNWGHDPLRDGPGKNGSARLPKLGKAAS